MSRCCILAPSAVEVSTLVVTGGSQVPRRRSPVLRCCFQQLVQWQLQRWKCTMDRKCCDVGGKCRDGACQQQDLWQLKRWWTRVGRKCRDVEPWKVRRVCYRSYENHPHRDQTASWVYSSRTSRSQHMLVVGRKCYGIESRKVRGAHDRSYEKHPHRDQIVSRVSS